MCAFSAIRICPVTGAGSVEHFEPASKYPDQAYEWSNYRFVCSRMNGRKQDHEDVFDPFHLPEDVFELNPVSGGIFVHPKCLPHIRTLAQSTINRLHLDDFLCRHERREHARKILDGSWSRQEGRSQSPFVFSRLLVQGLIGP
jgi:hypothetical protein